MARDRVARETTHHPKAYPRSWREWAGDMMMTITVTFPDGAQRQFPKDITGKDIAGGISPSLLKRTVAMAIDGELRDLADPISSDAKLEFLTREDPRSLELIRHDCAHVLAEAVQELWPGTQVTIGPVIENGFFYDFARDTPFTPEDFPAIEKKMREIIARDAAFTKEFWSREQAKDFFRAKGEAFKVELVDAIPAGEVLKMYAQGQWTDLCRVPHMTSVGKAPIGAGIRTTRCSPASTARPSRSRRNSTPIFTSWRRRKSATIAAWAAKWTFSISRMRGRARFSGIPGAGRCSSSSFPTCVAA
jgi:hypothetical protein